MSGFFFTFVLLVVAMAWSQWLTERVAWAPRVVWGFSAFWLLCLLIAGLSLMAAGPSLEGMNGGLRRAHLAAALAMWTSIGSLVAMVPLTVYAFTRGSAPAED